MDFKRAFPPGSRICLLFVAIVLLAACSRSLAQDPYDPAAAARAASQGQDSFYFQPAPSDKDVVEGGDVLLECDVSSRKHIVFYWALNDDPLKNSSRRFQYGSDLQILRVSREEDSGAYSCIATNASTGFSFQSREARLNILWIDKSAEVELKKPRLRSELQNGSELVLKCQVSGNPDPDVDWYKNNIRLFQDDVGTRIRFSKNRLAIPNAPGISAEDNGIYSCKAKNQAGTVQSSTNFMLNIDGGSAYPRLREDTFTKVLLVKKGDRAQLDCQYENAALIEWYHSDRLLQNSSRISILPNGTLVFNSVRGRDGGPYKCSGVTLAGIQQSFTAELVLASLADLTENSFEPRLSDGRPIVVPVNADFQVKCFLPSGEPSPAMRWEDPRSIALTTEGRISARGEKLVLTNAQQSDSGNYTCVAYNMAGETSHKVPIVVSVPPVIREPPRGQNVEELDMATLHCRVTGSPFPITQIQWIKDGRPLVALPPHYQLSMHQDTLRIMDAGMSDQGNYACRVNTSGHAVVTSSNARINVKRKLKFRPRPVNTKLELGSESRIHCKAEGDTPPAVKWLVKGRVTFPDHIRDINGVLIFDGVLHSDVGPYTCVAGSTTQGYINVTIQVDVVVKPRFKIRPANTTAYEGYPVMLNCVAIGDPTPTIQWDKNSKVNAFDLRRFKVLHNGSLLVNEIYMEDRGRYGCTAGNSGGFKREEIFLQVLSAEQYLRDQRKQNSAEEESFGMMKTVIIAVCSAGAYLALVIGLTLYCSRRLMKGKKARKAREESENLKAAGNGEVPRLPAERQELMEKEKDSSSHSHHSHPSSHHSHIKSPLSDDGHSHLSGISGSHSHSSRSSHSRRRGSYDRLQFPRHDLQTLGMLGKGEFGDVFLAKAHGIRDGEEETLVVVKSLLSKEESHHFEFRRELDMFSKVNHEHVVKLLGMCRDLEPQFMITDYCEWGDLKQFLWATRKDNGKMNVTLPPLNLAQKITICNQVALGMEALANHRLVHKDLAARNVLISPTLDVKVSLLGLCRDVYAGEYFLYHQALIPLRWMSPEAVIEDDISNKSDIWSFGVFMWEVFTLGDLPYRRRTDEEVLKGFKVGDLIPDPISVPDEIHQLMQRCWAECPKDRPSFSEITVAIGDMTVDSDV